MSDDKTLAENLRGCMEALASYAPDCIEVKCAREALTQQPSPQADEVRGGTKRRARQLLEQAANPIDGPHAMGPAGHMREDLEVVAARVAVEAIAQALAQPQPAASPQVSGEMLQTALRNLPQYISKSGLVGADKHSALQCVEVLREAVAALSPTQVSGGGEDLEARARAGKADPKCRVCWGTGHWYKLGSDGPVPCDCAALSPTQARPDDFTEKHGSDLRGIEVGKPLTQDQWDAVCAFVRDQDRIIEAYEEQARPDEICIRCGDKPDSADNCQLTLKGLIAYGRVAANPHQGTTRWHLIDLVRQMLPHLEMLDRMNESAEQARPDGGECDECEGRGYIVTYVDPYGRGDVSSPEHSPCPECAHPAPAPDAVGRLVEAAKFLLDEDDLPVVAGLASLREAMRPFTAAQKERK